jgi:hypothetical protein
MDRQRVFARRAGLYQQLDLQLRSRTRFFAAAALTNSVLANLFRFMPKRSLQDTYDLLSEAGAVLETANLAWAWDLVQTAAVADEVDQLFVRREQRLLQAFCCRAPVDADLNRLLNGRHWALLGAPWLGPSRRFGRILLNVRTELGDCFDFNLESHRVQLGLGIVLDVRVHGGCGTP